MSRAKTKTIIPLSELKIGYDYTIENAIRCLCASQDIVDEYPDKALPLAQIGQEEIGKSLTLLAGAALPADEDVWPWFWDGWRDHKLKAHRAYLYEIFNPLRIEIPKPDGSLYAGEPLRQSIQQEKENGLYVDYDRNRNVFINPYQDVDKVTAMCRISTLLYLSFTADAVRKAIFYDDGDFRMVEFGKISLTICSDNIYQQDWPLIKEQIKCKSARHSKFIEDLDTAISSVSAAFDHCPDKT